MVYGGFGAEEPRILMPLHYNTIVLEVKLIKEINSKAS
jgi:hypothetical protein